MGRGQNQTSLTETLNLRKKVNKQLCLKSYSAPFRLHLSFFTMHAGCLCQANTFLCLTIILSLYTRFTVGKSSGQNAHLFEDFLAKILLATVILFSNPIWIFFYRIQSWSAFFSHHSVHHDFFIIAKQAPFITVIQSQTS